MAEINDLVDQDAGDDFFDQAEQLAQVPRATITAQ